MNNDLELEFYEKLAAVYHLIFEDWETSIKQQGKILSTLLPPSIIASPILDCACGIGTQSLALASLGYEVEGIDLSIAEVKRAQKEAAARQLSINFRVDDMRQLKTAPLHHYGAVIAMDNALPHLNSNEEIEGALTAMRDRLKSGGTLLLSLRDYSALMQERPSSTPPKFFQDGIYKRIVHQIWDWQDERTYIIHLYITCENAKGWKSNHFIGKYRAVTVDEVVSIATKIGFVDVKILLPEVTGYYQIIIQGISL